jgi:hypothetical protein
MYAVVENTPGYMPDVEPALFSHWRDAVDYATELCDELREAGYAIRQEERTFWKATKSDLYAPDIGRVIQIETV